MTIIKGLFRNKFFWALFMISMIFLSIFLFLVNIIWITGGLTLTSFTTPLLVSLLISTLTTFATFISGIIALYIPFLMKKIEKSEEKEEERMMVKMVLKKIRDYFSIIFLKEGDKQDLQLEHNIPKTFPFFKSLSERLPMFLANCGISYENFSIGGGSETTYLYFLNKYHLQGGTQATLKFRVISANTHKVRIESKEQFKEIMDAIIDNIENNFSIKLDENEFLIKDNSLKLN